MSEKFQILLVDDQPLILKTLQRVLDSEEYLLHTAMNAEEALEVFRQKELDLVLLDVQLPDTSGLEVLKTIKDENPEVEVIIITGYPTLDLGVDSIRMGAFDFLTKPFDPIVKVQISVRLALERRHIIRENKELRESLQSRYRFGNLIGRSKPMQDIFALVKRLSQSESTVLVRGETGTGKELLAQSIHYNGPRKKARFVPVDCGAIPESLIESELFGHVKGAFTGALRDTKGLFREADRGTIFLDEIGDLPMAMQVRLLRAIQEREIRPVGGETPEPVDVRIIAATHRDLEDMVQQDKFREDLFYRLNVINIVIPPLRDRPEDIPVLIQHFLAKHSEQSGEDVSIEPKVVRTLSSFSWPGNVRQLEHCIEQMVMLRTSPVLKQKDIPESLVPAARETRIHERAISLKDFERMALENAMQKASGNIEQAAQILGIAKSSLYRKLKEHNIKSKDFLKK